MSFHDNLEDADEREKGEVYIVPKKEWFELQDHRGEMVLSCEEPWEVEP